MDASSREEVFETLRAKGIKAIKVVAADGSKANGEVRGVRKRQAAAVAAAAALAAGLAVYLALRPSAIPGGEEAGRGAQGAAPAAGPEAPAGGGRQAAAAPVAFRNAKPLARQAINGDRRRIEAAAAAFTNAAERFMAAFAEPGRPLPAVAGPRPADAEFEAALRSPVRIAETDFTETVDLKRIVAKIKNDLRAYMAAGGDIDGYIGELAKRQKLEASYREKAEKHLAKLCARQAAPGRNVKAEAYGYWLKANAQLQSMGIYPLPLPDALRGYEATIDIDED